jgi:hypothetical protein
MACLLNVDIFIVHRAPFILSSSVPGFKASNNTGSARRRTPSYTYIKVREGTVKEGIIYIAKRFQMHLTGSGMDSEGCLQEIGS